MAIFADRRPANLMHQNNDAAPLLHAMHVLMYLGDYCFQGEGGWMHVVQYSLTIKYFILSKRMADNKLQLTIGSLRLPNEPCTEMHSYH